MSRSAARAWSRLRVAALAAVVVAMPALAQRSLDVGFSHSAQTTDAPKELEGLAVTDRRGERLPMQATLRDESGQPVTIESIFADGRPRLLQLGYMKCPMLCSLALNGLVRGMQGLDWSVGDQFDVLFISINPAENAELAAAKRKGYAAEYGRSGKVY